MLSLETAVFSKVLAGFSSVSHGMRVTSTAKLLNSHESIRTT